MYCSPVPSSWQNVARIVTGSSLTQWAAVSTTDGLTRVPVQNAASLGFQISMPATEGNAFVKAPLMIRGTARTSGAVRAFGTACWAAFGSGFQSAAWAE